MPVAREPFAHSVNRTLATSLQSESEKRMAEKKWPARPKSTSCDVPGYFLSLTLENVRCFGPSQRLDLSDGDGKPARWTVILGVNGTGKTTILQSLVGFEVVHLTDKPDRDWPRFIDV